MIHPSKSEVRPGHYPCRCTAAEDGRRSLENCFYPEFDIKLRTNEVLMSGGSFLVLRTSQCQARQPRCRFAGFATTYSVSSRMEDGRRGSALAELARHQLSDQ